MAAAEPLLHAPLSFAPPPPAPLPFAPAPRAPAALPVAAARPGACGRQRDIVPLLGALAAARAAIAPVASASLGLALFFLCSGGWAVMSTILVVAERCRGVSGRRRSGGRRGAGARRDPRGHVGGGVGDARGTARVRARRRLLVRRWRRRAPPRPPPTPPQYDGVGVGGVGLGRRAEVGVNRGGGGVL